MIDYPNPDPSRCVATVYKRDTLRRTGRGRTGFEMHYNREQCQRAPMWCGRYCWQHAPASEPVEEVDRHRCWKCQRTRVCYQVGATVGGNYRTAPRHQRVWICADCCHYVVDTATPGHFTNTRVNIASAKRALEGIK